MWGGEPWDRWPLGRTDTPEGLTSLRAAMGSASEQVPARAAEFAAALPAAVNRAVNALSGEAQNKLDRLGLVPDLVRRAERCATVADSAHRGQDHPPAKV